MATSKSFSHYSLHISSHPRFNEWIANLLLRAGNILVVDIRFVSDPENWVAHGSISPNGVSQIYVGIDRYVLFVDMLRNEKPLFAVLYPSSNAMPARMILQTSPEPIGESEGT